jgi:hypothetical protein
MTRAAPLKPTTKALKALFFNAFTEFFLIIIAFLEVTITSTKFIVVYRNPRSQVLFEKSCSGVSLELEISSKCTLIRRSSSPYYFYRI